MYRTRAQRVTHPQFSRLHKNGLNSVTNAHRGYGLTMRQQAKAKRHCLLTLRSLSRGRFDGKEATCRKACSGKRGLWVFRMHCGGCSATVGLRMPLIKLHFYIPWEARVWAYLPVLQNKQTVGMWGERLRNLHIYTFIK